MLSAFTPDGLRRFFLGFGWQPQAVYGKVLAQTGQQVVHSPLVWHIPLWGIDSIAREKHTIDKESLFLFLRDRRGDFYKQVGIRLDASLQVSLHLGLVGKAFLMLPGNLPSIPGVIRVFRCVES